MPSGTNWLNFTFVNLGFIIQIVLMFYWIMAAEIRKDWNKYRCNPMFMPLSNNMQEDFTYCVQNIQTNYMGFLLQPITFLVSSLTALGGDLGEAEGLFLQVEETDIWAEVMGETRAEERPEFSLWASRSILSTQSTEC